MGQVLSLIHILTYDLVGYIWLDIFLEQAYVETVMLLVQQRPDDIVRVGIDTDELLSLIHI